MHDVTRSVKLGERVAVIGENGVGKATLLKIIDGVLPADAGSLTLGHEAQLGYFAQDHKDILDNPDDTPLSWLSRKVRDEGIAYTRGQLGRALFSGDDVQKRVAALSGGEAARLVFAGLSVEQPNMLLLDEPTNHLDIESIQALAEALNAYEGTLLFVSHDRAFVSSVATRIIELRRDGMRDFAGSFAEYLASCGDDHLDGEAVAKKVRAEKAASLDDTDEAASSWEEQKRKRNRHAQLHKRRDQVLKDLEVHERRKAAIDGLWTTDGFFEKTAPPEVKRLQDEEGTLRQSIDALMGEWERIEAELAT